MPKLSERGILTICLESAFGIGVTEEILEQLEQVIKKYRLERVPGSLHDFLRLAELRVISSQRDQGEKNPLRN